MESTKEKILRISFKLFLHKNFEKVTINELEQELGISRGCVFYYLKNKDELFRATIDKYIINPNTIDKDLNYNPNIKLLNFIENNINNVKELLSFGNNFEIENKSRAYFSIISQAVKYYPLFGDKLSKIIHEKHEVWEKVVLNAIHNKEIRNDMNPKLIAKNFRYIYIGISCEESLKTGLNIDDLSASLFSYYKLLKNNDA